MRAAQKETAYKEAARETERKRARERERETNTERERGGN